MDSTALGVEAYDNDENTAFKINKSDFKEYRINIDENIKLENIEIYADVPKVVWSSTADIKFYNNSNELLEIKTIPKEKHKTLFTVPDGTEYICICNNDYYTEVYIYDIATDLGKPEISYIMPKITGEGIEKSQILIKENADADKTYYKLNDNEWQEYNNEKIDIKKGDTLLAKGLCGNIYSIENKYTCTENIIETEAYDGNKETYMAVHINTGIRYINVDKSAWNKKINIKWWNWKYDGYYSKITFENESEESIAEYVLPSGALYDQEYDIPEGTIRLKYYVMVAGDNYWSPEGFGKLYEIELKQ